MSMTFAGVPILDWVLLLVLIGFGVEAYVTTRAPRTPSSSETLRKHVGCEDSPGDR